MLAPRKVTGYPNTQILVVVDLFNGSAAEVEGDLWEKIVGLSQN